MSSANSIAQGVPFSVTSAITSIMNSNNSGLSAGHVILMYTFVTKATNDRHLLTFLSYRPPSCSNGPAFIFTCDTLRYSAMYSTILDSFMYFLISSRHLFRGLHSALYIGETGVGCHTGWLSHCEYRIRWIAVPCGDLHVTCA